MWMTVDGGGSAINRTSTNEKEIGVSESVSESDTPHPLPHPRTCVLQYTLRSDLFTARCDPDVRGWGVGCFPNGRCWTTGEGGVQKVSFC